MSALFTAPRFVDGSLIPLVTLLILPLRHRDFSPVAFGFALAMGSVALEFRSVYGDLTTAAAIMTIRIRLAEARDIPLLRELIEASVRRLQGGYSPAQLEGALRTRRQ
jgi:hypothetical protein